MFATPLSSVRARLRAALRMLLALGASFGASFGTACGGADGMSAAPRVVESITVAPAAVTLVEGESRTLSAEVRDQDGSLFPASPVVWTSSDSTVARVVPGGLVAARRAGTATVRASSGGKTTAALVTVTARAVEPRPVARVITDAAEVALAVGDGRVIVARALDANGDPLERGFTWRSSDVTVATVDSAGRVIATGAGSATVTATSEGREATVRVSVSGQLWRLTRAADLPLPASAFTTTIAMNGTSREAMVVLTGGTLRFYKGGYVLRMTGVATVAGAAPVAVSFTSEGILLYDIVNGGPMLHEGSEWIDREPRFRGRFLDDGRMEIAWTPAVNAAVVPLVFVQ